MRVLEWTIGAPMSCDDGSTPALEMVSSDDPLARWVHEARLPAEVVRVYGSAAPTLTLDWDWLSKPGSVVALNEVLLSWSRGAAAVFLLLPPPDLDPRCVLNGYARTLEMLCTGLPPTIFCGEGSGVPVIATDI